MTTKPKTKAEPLKVQVGSVTVKIYRTKSATGYESFQVADYSSGKRVLRTFADEAEARREAKVIAKAISKGEAAVLSLTNQDKAAYVRALDNLKPTGTRIEIATLHFAEAFKILGGDRLLEA